MTTTNDTVLRDVMYMVEGVVESIKVLREHPEGMKAFEAWCDGIDFRDQFETRVKDVGDDMAHLMILAKYSVSLEAGVLTIEGGYSTYQWVGGEWKNTDDLGEDEDDE